MKNRTNILLALAFAATGLFAQDVEPAKGPADAGASPEVFTVVEQMPEYPGGIQEMYRFLGQHLQLPASAREKKVSGKCFVKFVVSAEGKVKDVQVLKTVPGCPDCDTEALRVVKLMPDWKPGAIDGRPVNVYYTLPISFKTSGSASTAMQVNDQQKLTPQQQQKHNEAMRYYNQGHKLDQESKYEEALENFNASLEQEPDNKYALFDKAKMELALGRKEQACDTWNKMITLNIRTDEVNEALKKNCN